MSAEPYEAKDATRNVERRMGGRAMSTLPRTKTGSARAGAGGAQFQGREVLEIGQLSELATGVAEATGAPSEAAPDYFRVPAPAAHDGEVGVAAPWRGSRCHSITHVCPYEFI